MKRINKSGKIMNTFPGDHNDNRSFITSTVLSNGISCSAV